MSNESKKEPVVKIEKCNGVSTIWLNRPEKKNAMSPELHEAMNRTLGELEEDPDTNIVIIRGAGGNYSAGQDLREFFRSMDENPLKAKRMATTANCWRWDRLYNYDKPTVSVVEGYCVGGAFMQLLATDFAIAADTAKFALSEINWGILPGGLVAKVVADSISYRHALYHACMGDAFDAKEAARIGIINYSVPPEQLEAEVDKLCDKLMKKSPFVLRATKQAIRHVRTMTFDQAYDYLSAKNSAIRVHDPENSYNAGMTQFIDKKSYKPAHGPFELSTRNKTSKHNN